MLSLSWSSSWSSSSSSSWWWWWWWWWLLLLLLLWLWLLSLSSSSSLSSLLMSLLLVACSLWLVTRAPKFKVILTVFTGYSPPKHKFQSFNQHSQNIVSSNSFEHGVAVQAFKQSAKQHLFQDFLNSYCNKTLLFTMFFECCGPKG